MKILPKIVLFFLLVTVIPMGILGGLAIQDIHNMQEKSISNFNSISSKTVDDSATALNDVGSEYIKQIANDVAKQIEIYLRSNPEMNVTDLQQDEYFQSLAVQPVGKTGYTAVTDVTTLTCRFHASPKIVDLDLHVLADKLPGFWGVMSRTQGGHVSEGKYDWAEADGSIRQKYMYIAIVNASTADGVTFSVAATTYLDEFNMPATEIKDKINKEVKSLSDDMDSLASEVSKRTLLFVIGAIILVSLVGIILAKGILNPIKLLNESGKKVANGELDTEMPEIRTKDEIKDLGDTINLLVGAVKYLKKNRK